MVIGWPSKLNKDDGGVLCGSWTSMNSLADFILLRRLTVLKLVYVFQATCYSF